MKCQQCQTHNPEQAVFCLNCGVRLVIFCVGCGARLPTHASFCFGCGLQVGAHPPGVHSAPAVQPASAASTEPHAAAAPPTPTPPLPSGEPAAIPPTPATAPAEPSPPVAPLETAAAQIPGPPEAPPDPLLEQLQRLVPKEYAERLLAAKEGVGGERRVVTILFSDVKGSTNMAEELDPEDVMEIMDGAFDVLIKPIYKHEGTLARLMGDAILAFFGAPLSHEDDPERAIRAALEIVEGAKNYAAQLEEERGIQGFNVRVGINTGLVVVGEVGSDLRVEYTAMGDAINLASRMEQNAPIGGVLVSNDTYRHVRGLFDVVPQEPLSVKGKAEPVQTFVVRSAKPRAFRTQTRGIEGIETQMVGRESELKRLQDAFYIAIEDSECQMATIVGDAGQGKSRLLYEFQLWAELQPETFHSFTGRAAQEQQGTPYALLRDLFAFRYDILDSDPPQVARQKITDGILDCGLPIVDRTPSGNGRNPEAEIEMRAHIIAHLLGFDYKDSPHVQGVLDDPQQLRDRAEIYLSDYFRAMAEQTPIMILLEDIHWADDSSLDIINGLARSMLDQRLTILCLARPTLFERRPHWGEGFTFHTRLDLQPLSKRDSRYLIKEILQKVGQIPTALRDLVTGGAEGNPFYLEELIKMLIEEGVIIKGEDRWQVDSGRLADTQVPSTLTGVLQARLDSLTTQERTILQQASVMGRVFWDSAVVRICAESESDTCVDDIRQTLSALRGREMIFQRETSAFSEAQEFTFKHATLRQVTYDSVLKRVRRSYHTLVADWLIEASGDGDGSFTGLIAEHLELAGRKTEAIPYLKRSGKQAAAQFANTEAVNYFSRALDLMPNDDIESRFELLLAREKVYNLQGERQTQFEDLEVLQVLAQTLDNNPQQAEVALRRATYFDVTSDFAAAMAAAQEALKWAERADDSQRMIQGQISWGRGLWRLGELEEARQRLAQALDLAQQHQVRSSEAASLHYLGTVMIFLGQHQEALVYLEQARDIRRSLGDQRGEATSLSNIAGIHHARGDYAQAKNYSQQVLNVYRAIGDRRNEAKALCNLGIIQHTLGELETARVHFQSALNLYSVVDDQRGEALTSENLGLVLHDLGDDQAARYHCEQALEIEKATGDRSGEAHSLTYLGLTLGGLGEWKAAEEAYTQALSLRREIGQEAQAIDDLAGLAHVALQRGHVDQALDFCEEILQWFDEHGVKGIEYPLRVYMLCADVLETVGQKERASETLTAAQALLQDRVAQISDPAARRTFLEEVPLHRQLQEQLYRFGIDIFQDQL